MAAVSSSNFFFFKEETLKISFLLTSSSCPLPLILIHLNCKISYSRWLSADSSPVENLSSEVSLGSPLCFSQGRGKAAVYIHFHLCNFVIPCSFFGCHFIFSKVTSVMNAEAQGRIQTVALGHSVQLPKHRYMVKLGSPTWPPATALGSTGLLWLLTCTCQPYKDVSRGISSATGLLYTGK